MDELNRLSEWLIRSIDVYDVPRDRSGGFASPFVSTKQPMVEQILAALRYVGNLTKFVLFFMYIPIQSHA